MFKSMQKKVFGAVALAAFSFSNAYALPFIWTDEYDPADFKLSSPNTHTYSHDITDGLYGFRPGVDDIWTASLSIFLYDDLDLLSGEEVRFKFDGGAWTSEKSVGGLTSLLPDVFAFNAGALALDGIINVIVQATEGDFWFKKSELIVTGWRDSNGSGSGSGSTNVPEPSGLGLIGLALLGAGFAARRKARQ